MRIANGYTLILAIPIVGYDGEIERYMIAAYRDHVTKDGIRIIEYVTAYMKTLDDPEWYWGDYFNGNDGTLDTCSVMLCRAIRDAHRRATSETGSTVPPYLSRDGETRSCPQCGETLPDGTIHNWNLRQGCVPEKVNQ